MDKMETSREYYARVMSDHRARSGRRSLRKYCQDEGVDYQWLLRSCKKYFAQERPEEVRQLPGTSERLEARQKNSRPLVDKFMTLLRKVCLNSNKYGTPVMKAVNYILDDEVAFSCFLDNGHVEMHNITAESMFRHIAMARRNWMHVGSHGAAENISLVYFLLEFPYDSKTQQPMSQNGVRRGNQKIITTNQDHCLSNLLKKQVDGDWMTYGCWATTSRSIMSVSSRIPSKASLTTPNTNLWRWLSLHGKQRNRLIEKG